MTIPEGFSRKELKERGDEFVDSLRTLRPLWLIILFASATLPASAQIQQAWVAKYNNGITNGYHQGLKMALDSGGNIYVMGVSANGNTNTGYAIVKYAPNGHQMWAARYDSTNFPNAAPTGFALDSRNNVVETGSAITVKYNANGNLLWTAPYDAQALAVDMGQNVYITGVSGNFTTIKLNPAGSNVWIETWTFQGQTNNVGQSIAVDLSSNVYVAGGQSVPGSIRANPVVVALKYDRNGNQLWETELAGGFYGPEVAGVAIDNFGAMYVEFNFVNGAGAEGSYLTSKVNTNGDQVWFDYNPTGSVGSVSHDLVLDKQDNILITGGYGYAAPMAYTYGTYKLSANGSYIWTNFYPSTTVGNSTATSVAADQADSVYVTGFSTNAITGNDIVTIKYDANGNQVWLQRYDGPGHGDDAGNAIAVDNSGNVYVAGYETETNGFTSMILIKYSPVTLQKQASGNFILDAYGSPGETFDIQASTNLQTWQDLGDVIADTNGLVQFDDTNAPSFNYRFYYTLPQ